MHVANWHISDEFISVHFDRLRVIRSLLAHGADVNASMTATNRLDARSGPTIGVAGTYPASATAGARPTLSPRTSARTMGITSETPDRPNLCRICAGEAFDPTARTGTRLLTDATLNRSRA